jgi:hypothetical protein
MHDGSSHTVLSRLSLFIAGYAARMLLLCLVLVGLTGPVRAQIVKLEHPDTTVGNFFGAAVSIDGNRALVGASGVDVCGPNSGAAYIFDWNEAEDIWEETAKLTASDCASGTYFGRTVSLSGDRVLIGSSKEFFATKASSAAYIFERDSTGAWSQVARLTADPLLEEGAFASSVSLDGHRALITTSGDPSGRRYAGAAYIFERDPQTGAWERTARLIGSADVRHGIFGGSGDLAGNRIAVAASRYEEGRAGSVYLFERDPASGFWQEIQRISGIEDFFISLDLHGDRLLIGESRHGRRNSGTVTSYQRGADGTWQEAEGIQPRSAYEHGAFGSIVALDGHHALVVAYDEQLGFNFNIDRVVYLYRYNAAENQWTQERVIDVGEIFFASSVDLSEQWALIGEASEQKTGAAYVVRLPAELVLGNE